MNCTLPRTGSSLLAMAAVALILLALGAVVLLLRRGHRAGGLLVVLLAVMVGGSVLGPPAPAGAQSADGCRPPATTPTGVDATSTSSSTTSTGPTTTVAPSTTAVPTTAVPTTVASTTTSTVTTTPPVPAPDVIVVMDLEAFDLWELTGTFQVQNVGTAPTVGPIVVRVTPEYVDELELGDPGEHWTVFVDEDAVEYVFTYSGPPLAPGELSTPAEMEEIELRITGPEPVYEMVADDGTGGETNAANNAAVYRAPSPDLTVEVLGWQLVDAGVEVRVQVHNGGTAPTDGSPLTVGARFTADEVDELGGPDGVDWTVSGAETLNPTFTYGGPALAPGASTTVLTFTIDVVNDGTTIEFFSGDNELEFNHQNNDATLVIPPF